MKTSNKLTLATRKFANENIARSWSETITTSLLLLSSLISSALVPVFPIQLLISVLSGLLMIRLFVIYHDFLHQAILRQSKIANVLFTLFGIYILVPKSVWKISHEFHHRNNSKLYSTHIGSYPVFSKVRFEKSSTRTKRLYLFQRHPLTLLFGYIFTFLIGMCIRPSINNIKKHFDAFISVLFHLTFQLLILYFFGFKILFVVSIFPHFISCAIGSYLFYVQHNFPEVKLKCKNHWTYEGAALESSSYLKTNRIMNWFTANIGYHHIHHLNARIPFYRLPEVMNSLAELQQPKTTNFSFYEIKNCLKLKLWDEEIEQLIPLK